jgi:hypothetical protein
MLGHSCQDRASVPSLSGAPPPGTSAAAGARTAQRRDH